jgi:hypothetical protein
MDADGDFAVLYSSNKQAPKSIKVQRFTAAGNATGKAINVKTFNLWGGEESIAMDATGRFVVAWDDAVSNGSGIVLRSNAQQFAAKGSLVGSTMLLDSVPNPSQALRSNVSMNGAGRFVINWNDRNEGNQAQTFDWLTPVGGPIVFSHTGDQNVAADIDADGDVTLSWTQANEVRFRRLTAGGILEPEYIVNTTIHRSQENLGLASTGNDRFVVAWQGHGPGDDSGIFAQRFKPLGTSPIGNPGGTSGDGKAFFIWNSDSEVSRGPAVIAHRAVTSCFVDDRQIVLQARDAPAIHHDRLIAVRNVDDLQIDDEPLTTLWSIRLGT